MKRALEALEGVTAIIVVALTGYLVGLTISYVLVNIYLALQP